VNKSERLIEIIKKKSRRVIGLMSGMSMDGIDLACAQITGEFPDLKVDLIGSHFTPYPASLQMRLLAALNGPTEEVSTLNFIVAQEFSNCVLEYLQQSGTPATAIDVIGSHGQTLFHSMGPLRSSLQVGSPSIISERTGILTIGNFRVRDIAAGGQGAPLVGLADYVLFREPTGPVALNNLGSISNVTIVTPQAEDMLAFDTGPANMAIDFFARLIPGGGVDQDGRFSAQGVCIQKLLDDLLQHPFFAQPPPKAAGYAEFGPAVLTELSRPYLRASAYDLIRTAVEFAAVTLEQAYRNFVFPRFPGLKVAHFSGGGIYNLTLMHRIQDLLPELKVTRLESRLGDAKEALAFALLANEALSGRPGSFRATTGIKTPTVLGEIAL
jgi:anhydro-N-acetylmuramic acid kinase